MRTSAGAALPAVIALLPGGRIPAQALRRAPRATDRGYRWVADHRSLLGRAIPTSAKRRATTLISARTHEPPGCSLQIATDADVRAMAATAAVEAMREVLASADRGQLRAPPRIRAELDGFDYVYTVGQLADGTSGFRAYRAGRPAGDQLTAVWAPTGELRGIVIGDELGARRTGALGAVAADLLAREAATSVGVIGAGTQAWTQLWALCAVRPIETVTVYSRRPENREAFAGRVRAELDLDARRAARAPRGGARRGRHRAGDDVALAGDRGRRDGTRDARDERGPESESAATRSDPARAQAAIIACD